MNRHAHRAKTYVNHILGAAIDIRQFVVGQTRQDFFENRMMQAAIMRNIEVLGEASKRLLDVLPEAPTRFPSIPFRSMYLMRNRLIHGYDTVRLDTVWEVAQKDIPAIIQGIESALSSWPADLL